MLGPLMAVPFVYGESDEDDVNMTTTESPSMEQELYVEIGRASCRERV